ncbi:MAG: porin family protein [Flavisolibacter sp.]
MRFAVYAGPQTTSASYKVEDEKQPTAWKYGAMAGVSVKVPFDNQLFFFPSIYYSLKGYKVTLNKPSFPPTEFAINNNTTLHTVEISPLFQIDITKKTSHPFVRFGPAVDFAFSGNEKFDTVSRTGVVGSVERPMVFSFGDYGRFTAQAIIHLGYETDNHLMVFAFYEHGFGSLNNADGGPRILHRIFGLSVGWLFNETGK